MVRYMSDLPWPGDWNTAVGSWADMPRCQAGTRGLRTTTVQLGSGGSDFTSGSLNDR